MASSELMSKVEDIDAMHTDGHGSDEDGREDAESNDTSIEEGNHQFYMDEVNGLRKNILTCERHIKELAKYKEFADHQQRQNESLMKDMACLTQKVEAFEEKTTKLEEDKKNEHREHKNQLAKMRKRVKSLSTSLRKKEDSIMPGLVKEIKQKGTDLKQCQTNLLSVEHEVVNLTHRLNNCSQELSTTNEERDILTCELQGHICDTGRITNEMADVLSLREDMAKQYYKEKCDLVEHISKLEEEGRRKQRLIERLSARVAEAQQAVVVDIQDAPPYFRNTRPNRVARWLEARLGPTWLVNTILASVTITIVAAFVIANAVGS